MDSFSFRCYGHSNISCKHKNTFEFTKDDFVTKKGDCIVGCKADFDFEKLKRFVSKVGKGDNHSQQEKFDKKEVINKNDNEIKKNVKIVISVDGSVEEAFGVLNSEFCDEREIVIRKSDFLSDRTLVFGCDKGAVDFSDEFREKVCVEDIEISVSIRVMN